MQNRRLAQLYVIAAVCFVFGRLNEAMGYADAGQAAIATRQFDEVPYEFTAWSGGAYVAQGQPERWIDLCRNMIEYEWGTHAIARGCLAMAYNVVGAGDKSKAASEGLLAVADATDNPQVACAALMSYGVGLRGTDPVGARKVLRRALRIAEESGNVIMQGHMNATLSRLTLNHGEPAEAFDYLAATIRNFYDAGSFSLVYRPLAILTALFDRLGIYEPAATISGFAATPWTRSANPELATAISHLREVLGDERCEALASVGEEMTNAGVAAYALEQIDRARAKLHADQET